MEKTRRTSIEKIYKFDYYIKMFKFCKAPNTTYSKDKRQIRKRYLQLTFTQCMYQQGNKKNKQK